MPKKKHNKLLIGTLIVILILILLILLNYFEVIDLSQFLSTGYQTGSTGTSGAGIGGIK